MAVQKSKKSRSKRDMRRFHDSLTAMPVSSDKTTGSSTLDIILQKTVFTEVKKSLHQK